MLEILQSNQYIRQRYVFCRKIGEKESITILSPRHILKNLLKKWKFMNNYLCNSLKKQKDKRIKRYEMIKQKCGLTVGALLTY